MKRVDPKTAFILGFAALSTASALACSRSSESSSPAPSDESSNPTPVPTVNPEPPLNPEGLPEGHPALQDTAPKEGARLVPTETLIRSYLQLFGGLAPIPAAQALRGSDGTQLFDNWNDYINALGLPDYRTDVPRAGRTNTLMMASFERIGVALCDRALERDRTGTTRLLFDFATSEAAPSREAFEPNFDKLHRTFLGYPAALAPTDRTNRFFALYTDTVRSHPIRDAGADARPADAGTTSRFTPGEAGWAAVCYGLVRHPEFITY